MVGSFFRSMISSAMGGWLCLYTKHEFSPIEWTLIAIRQLVCHSCLIGEIQQVWSLCGSWVLQKVRTTSCPSPLEARIIPSIETCVCVCAYTSLDTHTNIKTIKRPGIWERWTLEESVISFRCCERFREMTVSEVPAWQSWKPSSDLKHKKVGHRNRCLRS